MVLAWRYLRRNNGSIAKQALQWTMQGNAEGHQAQYLEKTSGKGNVDGGLRYQWRKIEVAA